MGQMMTKEEMLKKLWIPYSKRLPPKEDIMIVAWNYFHNKPVVGLSNIFRAQIEQIKNNPQLLEEWKNRKASKADLIVYGAYKTSHWIYLPSPESGIPF